MAATSALAAAPRFGLRYGAMVLCAIAIVASSSESAFHWVAWSIAQWMPLFGWLVGAARGAAINEAAWAFWERSRGEHAQRGSEEIPEVDVQDHLNDLLPYLERTYGKDWRKRPLLLKRLWSLEALRGNSTRRLSLKGLLKENQTIPYFSDARVRGALSPDSHAPIKDIVANMTLGAPHKIGTQLFVQTWPELINEAAPVHVVTELFGPYFSPEAVRGTGPFQLLPALTTVPLFVASGKTTESPPPDERGEEASFAQSHPYTALHCEPIGNVAVQLAGMKQWTLVRPEFSRFVKPSASSDGRAFFASGSVDYTHVPTYEAITSAGDAIWVPTWTWHRVDYVESEEVAIGASLFHFRPFDFVTSNPSFAAIIVPAILLELLGYNTQ